MAVLAVSHRIVQILPVVNDDGHRLFVALLTTEAAGLVSEYGGKIQGIGVFVIVKHDDVLAYKKARDICGP